MRARGARDAARRARARERDALLGAVRECAFVASDDEPDESDETDETDDDATLFWCARWAGGGGGGDPPPSPPGSDAAAGSAAAAAGSADAAARGAAEDGGGADGPVALTLATS